MGFFRKISICHFVQPTMPPTGQPTGQPTVPPTGPPDLPPTGPPTGPPMVTDLGFGDFSYTEHVVPRAARKLKTNNTTFIWKNLSK